MEYFKHNDINDLIRILEEQAVKDKKVNIFFSDSICITMYFLNKCSIFFFLFVALRVFFGRNNFYHTIGILLPPSKIYTFHNKWFLIFLRLFNFKAKTEDP